MINTETVARPSRERKFFLVPFVLVTSLFFLWGMANILNGALITHFQPVFEIPRALALLVETAFYLGYFTIAIPAGLFMEKYSYKKGIVFGLLLYAVGALLFVPAAKMLVFGFFLVALYIIASGLAFLETAANPYITILGGEKQAVQRLNLAQSFNGVALVVGPYLAGELIFKGNEGDMSTLTEKQQAAEAVILPYVLIASTVLLVAVLFMLVKMPEPDKGEGLRLDKRIFRHRHLVLAVLAQFCYVGAQAGIWGITIDYVITMIPGVSREDASKDYFLLGTALFVVGRFVGTALMMRVKDSRLLTLYGGIACILSFVGAIGGGDLAVYSVLSINFFMSIMFPTIFALGVKDLGKNTKLGSSFIIMAIVGGAVLPPIMGLFENIQHAFAVPSLCFVVVSFYGSIGHRVKPVVP